MGQQLIQGTHELVCELVKRITDGESFNNSKLKRLSELRNLLNRLPTQSMRPNEQVEFQQFSTPPTIAFVAAQLLDLQPNDVVLEPSAGTGSLAIWPRSAGAKVVCNEIDPRRRALLEDVLGFETLSLDAGIIDDVLPAAIIPTAVLMNPPFTGTGGHVVVHRNKYGLLHIEGALRRLKDEGRLVAIASEAVSFERPAATGWWQRIAKNYTIRRDVSVTVQYQSGTRPPLFPLIRTALWPRHPLCPPGHR